MFVNGATPDGRAHAGVRRFAASLARAGYIVFIPELPGVAGGELSLPTLAASVECAVTAADSAETRNGRIALVGVSVGGTLALLAAATPDLSTRISVVACIAPFTDLEKVIMLATTGMYPGDDGPASYPVPPALPVGVARSLVGSLDPTPDARALGRALASLDPTSPDPLSRLRDAPCRSLGPAAAAAQALLINRDPLRCECLFAALPDAVRRVVVSLSPLRSAARLSAPIEIVTAPRDKYFPLSESLALQGEVAGVRITVTSALEHATPRLTLESVGDFGRLQGFIARSLGAAGAC
jgi:pimeloyl-ACP methyl ester carboxylesterase